MSQMMLRRPRAVVGNALFWGAGWFVTSFLILSVLRLVGATSGTWLAILQGSLRASLVGTIAGAAFSTFIALRYQGRRILEINWLRFGIGGAIVAGIFMPAFMVVTRFLSGDPFLPIGALLEHGALPAAIFGGVAAAGSMKIAQLAANSGGTGDEPELLENADRSTLGSGTAEPDLSMRAREAERVEQSDG